MQHMCHCWQADLARQWLELFRMLRLQHELWGPWRLCMLLSSHHAAPPNGRGLLVLQWQQRLGLTSLLCSCVATHRDTFATISLPAAGQGRGNSVVLSLLL